MNKAIITRIKRDQWYRIGDIAAQGFILNTVGKTDRRYIYSLIELGKLRARNFSMSKKLPLYMVSGEELIRFIKKTYL